MSSENTASTETSDERTAASGMVSVPESDASWSPYFRYDAAYADQYEGIERFLSLLDENVFTRSKGRVELAKR